MKRVASPRTLLLAWTGLAVLTAALDFYLGPTLQFPILYIFPVGLAAWYNGFAVGLVFAFALPATRLWIATTWWDETGVAQLVANAAIRSAVLTALAFFAHQTAQRTRLLAQRVRSIEGLLPICGLCKKIRDERGTWHRLESYISEHSTATFSHGVCEQCAREHYGDLLDEPGRKPDQGL